MGVFDALKGAAKLTTGLVGGIFKVGGGILKAGGDFVGGAITKTVGVFSPGAQKWLEQTGQNFKDGFSNWEDSFANSADLGKIGNLKKMLINTFIKFAVALQKKMVTQAEKTGEKIVDAKTNIGTSSKSIATGKVDMKEAKAGLQASKQDKSINNVLSKATAKSNAINKTNKSIGLGGSEKTQTIKR